MFSLSLIAVILLALLFDFINGFHDTANSIATSVSTRVLTPRMAILMSVCLNFVGALVSESVAKTISKGLVAGEIAQYVIISALIGAIIWNLITWYLGIPSSSSHALIGSLVGAAIAYAGGFKNIIWSGVLDKVVIPLFSSPVIGFVFGFLVMKLLYFIFRFCSQRSVNKWFSKLQICSAAVMAYSHGSNDAQKSMGIITLALVSAGVWSANAGIPIEVKLICAIAMALGTSIGGWKIIKTIGVNMIQLQPIGGFAAETSAALVIQVMTAFGAPVSTTHVISSAIMGVGASKRLSAVRWALARNIVWAWIFTIPVTMALGAAVTMLFKLFIH
ncbi:MAG: inorganic phosphate transporter [Clostridia bacterium]|nr:inorganic phosphate transporter [Clostridia bacterium]MDR3644426.1 inorganic phosphate transporter [Clostridia bacterium]